jgi:hypothetical protein
MLRVRRALWHRIVVPSYRLFQCQSCHHRTLAKLGDVQDTIIRREPSAHV